MIKSRIVLWMTSAIGVAIVGYAAVAMFSSASEPRLKISKTEIDLGIIEEGETVMARFKLMNTRETSVKYRTR